jgi:neuropeptide S receptor 1
MFLVLGFADGEHVSIDDQNSRRASSRGLIPKAKIKTVKMTFVIVFGKTRGNSRVSMR